jgi:hypothetical protein
MFCELTPDESCRNHHAMTSQRQPASTIWLLRSLALWFACCQLTACRTAPHGTSTTLPPRPPGQHYAHIFGQRYRTTTDLYLFMFTADPDLIYLGINRPPQFGPKELPASVSAANVGQIYKHWAEDGLGDVKILDAIPAGSELTIDAETHEVTALSSVRGASGYPMGFICTLKRGDQELHGVLTEFIQSHTEVSAKVPNQRLDESIATRIAP